MFKNFRKLKVIALVVVALIALAWVTRIMISEDQANRISRLGVSYLDGDYKVTYVGFTGDKTWIVTGGKITSEPEKGYYFFWADNPSNKKKIYVQIPMGSTLIEEIAKK